MRTLFLACVTLLAGFTSFGARAQTPADTIKVASERVVDVVGSDRDAFLIEVERLGRQGLLRVAFGVEAVEEETVRITAPQST